MGTSREPNPGEQAVQSNIHYIMGSLPFIRDTRWCHLVNRVYNPLGVHRIKQLPKNTFVRWNKI